MNQKYRKTLLACLAASLFAHAMAFVFLQRYSLWFSSQAKLDNNASWLSLIDKKERDHILKTAFEPLSEEKEVAVVSYQPQKESPSSRSLALSSEREFASSIFFQNSLFFSLDEFLIAKPVLPTFSVPFEPLNLLDHIPKDLIVPVPIKQRQPLFHPQPNPLNVALPSTLPSLKQEAPPTELTYSGFPSLPLTDAPQIAKVPSMIPIPNLPTLPTLDELETASYSDSFDADLVFLPREEGGYIFALTLIPKPDLQLPRIKQHFTFLIDKSNSIQQGRLSSTKAAVHKVLEELSPEDTFNIIAFDSKMEKMSPHSLPCYGKSFATAEDFLEKIQLGSFFSYSDLYKPLLLTVPGQVQNDEMYTAILLTDSETLAKKTTQRSLLHDWTHYNHGRVTLYAVGLNSDSYTATLDAAAALNKGKLSNTSTHRGLKRKLLKLMKTIQNPVVKNLSCQAISRSPNAKIHLYPNAAQMPPLFVDQPYVILGESETLDDFILFAQGRLKDRWLNIKKTISFVNARKGNKSLKQEWALQRAYNLYERYVQDDDPKHIADAAALLEPYDYRVAFK